MKIFIMKYTKYIYMCTAHTHTHIYAWSTKNVSYSAQVVTPSGHMKLEENADGCKTGKYL